MTLKLGRCFFLPWRRRWQPRQPRTRVGYSGTEAADMLINGQALCVATPSTNTKITWLASIAGRLSSGGSGRHGKKIHGSPFGVWSLTSGRFCVRSAHSRWQIWGWTFELRSRRNWRSGRCWHFSMSEASHSVVVAVVQAATFRRSGSEIFPHFWRPTIPARACQRSAIGLPKESVLCFSYRRGKGGEASD